MKQTHDIPAMRQWLGTASPGDTAEYHRGYIFRDRHGSPSANGISRKANVALRWQADECVSLVQYRHGPGDYSYRMQAR